MSKNPFATTPDGYSLTAIADRPDSRDIYYRPALIQLARDKDPDTAKIHILDQLKEGACTGFGLAAVINLLNTQRGSDTKVSPRMLYNLAQKFDRWPGEDYSGSSCRGAIRGWASMGVCSEALWPYVEGDTSDLNLDRVRDARSNGIGAYYRLKHQVGDFHAALNEVDAIYVSADVHPGWWTQNIRGGIITPSRDVTGGHAFAVVGYNDRGFWVQNSWGAGWGEGGLALWLYEDWQVNLKDAWVVRLALPTPQIFPGTAHGRSMQTGEAFSLFKRKPQRHEIAGHFVHIDDGRFHDTGRYWSTARDVALTADYVAGHKEYKHLLFYAHGGLNDVSDSARRVRAMKDVFKANGIYPFHFMYDTGLLEEIKDVLLGRFEKSGSQVASFTDYTDRLLETKTQAVGRALWREMKQGGKRPFDTKQGAGSQVLDAFLSSLAKTGRKTKIHLVGHSAGGVLLAYLIEALKRRHRGTEISSCSLLAPAATVDLYESHYAKTLGSLVKKLRVYNLSEQTELDDDVAVVYRKSLLYLVSRSYEEDPVAPLLGMKLYSDDIKPPASADMDFIYSRKDRGPCRATTHGGFDNDEHTLNSILKTVLGKKPKRKFTEDDLDY
jgi:hypothetical protein